MLLIHNGFWVALLNKLLHEAANIPLNILELGNKYRNMRLDDLIEKTVEFLPNYEKFKMILNLFLIVLKCCLLLVNSADNLP